MTTHRCNCWQNDRIQHRRIRNVVIQLHILNFVQNARLGRRECIHYILVIIILKLMMRMGLWLGKRDSGAIMGLLDCSWRHMSNSTLLKLRFLGRSRWGKWRQLAFGCDR